VVSWSLLSATVDSPHKATINANHCKRESFSPSKKTVKPMVKKTCDWITKEAIPGDTKRWRAKNRRPNCPKPIQRPYVAKFLSGTRGKGIKKAAGKNAKANRKKANKKGGICTRANLMTTKLVPQIKTIVKANAQCANESFSSLIPAMLALEDQNTNCSRKTKPYGSYANTKIQTPWWPVVAENQYKIIKVAQWYSKHLAKSSTAPHLTARSKQE